MPIPCWRRAPSPPGRGSKKTKRLPRFPSGLHVSVNGANSAPRGNSIHFLDFMAAVEPSESKIQGCRPDNQGGKNEKLHKEPRVQREARVVIPKPAGNAHNAGADGNFREGPENTHGSERAIANAENNKK